MNTTPLHPQTPTAHQIHWPLVLLGTLAMLGSTAQAQNVQAYQQLAQSLDKAASSITKDRVATIGHFDQALSAFEQLRPSINRRSAQSILNAITSARAAQARTPAEVQAQIDLTRGLMRKTLYDQALAEWAANPNNVRTDTNRIQLLGREFGLEGDALANMAADAKSGQLSRVAWRLQRSAASKVKAYLGNTPAQQSQSAYLNLVKATAWFTAIQEAGQKLEPPLMMSQFQGALQELSAGQTAALKQSLSKLGKGSSSLASSLANAPQSAAEAASTPNKSSPLPTPVRDPQVLFAGGVAGAYAALAKAYTAADHGNPEKARSELAAVQPALEGSNSPLLRSPEYVSFLKNLKATQQRMGLRPTDISGLMADLDRLERNVTGAPVSLADSASVVSAQLLGGPWRAILFLVLGLFALWPLRLMRMAFGTQRAWNMVFWAFVLLLLPSMLEGLFGALAFLGDLLGVGFLRPLSNLTFTQGAYGILLTLLTQIAAVGLATAGMYSLCVQFGLLGKGGKKAPPLPARMEWEEEGS